MIVTLKYFGLIVDITHQNDEEFEIENNSVSLQNLHSLLKEKYPELLNTKYSLAVNQVVIIENLELNNNDEVALLPPFAGG